ncbi:MAG: hypothetical protein ACKO1I_10620 [Microcystis aeruginosa]
MNTKSKTKLTKLIQQMHENQINHLKKHLNAVETMGQANDYRRRRLTEQNNINYKNEYDRIVGELSQSNIPVRTRHAFEQRKKMIKKAYDDSLTAKDILFP